MDATAFGTGPLAHVQRHLCHGVPAVAASLAGGIPAVDADQRAPVPLRLVSQLPQELRPAGISNRLGQMSVLLHVADSQHLDGDHLVLVDQTGRELVQEVPANVDNAGMCPGDLAPRLRAVLRAFLLFRQPTLQLCELRFMLAKDVGSGDLLAAGEDGEVRQPQVDADLAADFGQRLHRVIAQHGDEVPPGCVARDRDRRHARGLRNRAREADG